MPSPLNASMKRLSTAQARKRRQDLGPPLALSDADMTVLSNVGPTDQGLVTAFVRSVAPRGVAMLEAG
jgi:hypothetical protein